MKRVMYVLSLVLFSSHNFCEQSYGMYDPLLVVVIMVKNEEKVMEATLQPFFDGGVDSFFVFDTGSTDNTVSVTQDFFEKNNIEHGYIAQEPFVDFATSRNRALELAHEKFPFAAFMVMPDAEWYINDARGLIDFCQLCLDCGENYPSYLIHIVNQALDNYVCRLIRCNRDVRFGGVVHEAIFQSTHIKVPGNIFFQYLPTDDGFKKTEKRFIRDRELLFKEHQKNPNDTRTLFYLARTCEDLGDLHAAYDFYKKRVDMVGWDEEDFIVHYRLGETIKKLILHKNDRQYQWSEALDYYMKAFQMRSCRAESLIAIADYYVITGQMEAAYVFARHAAEIEYPSADVLFVEKYLYNYYRYELLTRCAWYIDEFEIGEWAAKKAYDAYPEYEIARRNLIFYLERNLSVV